MDHPRTAAYILRARPEAFQWRVLLVDADMTSRAALRGLLEEYRYSVVAEAATGPEAIAAAGAHSPDVVVLDTHLLGRDALHVSKAITTTKAATQVVLVTLVDPAVIRAEVGAAGAFGAVAKGHPDRLLAAMDLAFGSRQALLAAQTATARCRFGA